ncbi:hypothetical protein C0J52_13727 [Blattella germanica]|nr:hypothetical protein C0J52_13727 [Blattella germanica]
MDYLQEHTVQLCVVPKNESLYSVCEQKLQSTGWKLVQYNVFLYDITGDLKKVRLLLTLILDL